MGDMPRTHKQAERRIIAMVRDGAWTIDDEGRIWWAGRPTLRAEKHLPSGYWMVRMMRDKFRHVGLSHRLVWQHLHGDIPDGMVVNHIDGDKGNNRPANLEIVTSSGNLKHAYRTGLRHENGEVNPAAKLSNAQVVEIRELYAAGGVTQLQLAGRFGVTHQAVSKIVRGHCRQTQSGPMSTVNRGRNDVRERDPVHGRFVGRRSSAGGSP